MKKENSAKYFMDHPELSFYLQQIIREMNPLKVILFGSKARGDFSGESDTDLAVINDHFADTTGIYGAADIVDFNRASPALQEQILKEGVVLYER